METFTRHTGQRFSMFSNKRFWTKKIIEEGGASTIKMNKIFRQNNALKDFILSIKHSCIVYSLIHRKHYFGKRWRYLTSGSSFRKCRPEIVQGHMHRVECASNLFPSPSSISST
jgi:hypothetical protein